MREEFNKLMELYKTARTLQRLAEYDGSKWKEYAQAEMAYQDARAKFALKKSEPSIEKNIFLLKVGAKVIFSPDGCCGTPRRAEIIAIHLWGAMTTTVDLVFENQDVASGVYLKDILVSEESLKKNEE